MPAKLPHNRTEHDETREAFYYTHQNAPVRSAQSQKVLDMKYYLVTEHETLIKHIQRTVLVGFTLYDDAARVRRHRFDNDDNILIRLF